MRGVLVVLCGVVAAGVFLLMYLALWSTRQRSDRATAFRQHLISEFVWATIPILMVLAAAVPAAVAVLSGETAH